MTTTNQTTAIELCNAALTHEKSDTVILCDVSGSMNDRINSIARSKFDVMSDALLQAVSSLSSAAVFLFGSKVGRLTSFEAMWALRSTLGHNTNLEAALREAARLNPAHIIIITDGQPSRADEALIVARRMLCKIDVFYCGSGASQEVQFCRDIAQFGGQAVIDPACVTMLETVTLFLGDGVIATEAAPELSEAAKRTRDFLSAAHVQMTEDRNRRGAA
jgi:hypothetical protein